MMTDPLDVLSPPTVLAARRVRGVTAQMLAELAGVHVTTIRRIEAGTVDPRVEGTWAGIVLALRALPLLADQAQTDADEKP